MKLPARIGSAITALAAVVLAVPVLPVRAEAPDDPDFDPEPSVLISEIQTRTEDDAYNEFVELYNVSDEAIDLSEWELQYMTASGDSWSGKIRGEQHQEPTFTIEPRSHYLLGTENFIEANPDVEVHRTLSSGAAESGGHIGLMRPSEEDTENLTVVDLVGWGTAESGLEEPAPAPERGTSIYRCLVEEEMINTRNNADDFHVSETPRPNENRDCPDEPEDDEGHDGDGDETTDNGDGEDDDDGNGDGESDDDENGSEEYDSCEDIGITEVLPESLDGQYDDGYIELYNFGDETANLHDCGLEFMYNQENEDADTDTAETVWFDTDIELEPGNYTIFYFDTLEISIPEDSSPSIYLLYHDNDEEIEIGETSFDHSDHQDAAWALIEEDWQWTYTPTPNEDNIRQPHESVCDGIVISELLPNPEGPRSQRPREEHAYIELHNPEDEPINLIGCGLQTLSVNSQSYSDIYWFEDDLELEPGQHLAVYERDSGIALPVGVAGQAFLLSANEDEIDSADYQPDIPEAAAWAEFESGWEWTYAPSPDEANEKMPLKPCPEGEERNPDSGRCRQIASAETEYEPCGPGRERNPETNRCRQIGADEPDYVPCGPGEERNPETNRCRSVASKTSSLKPCGPNQERNPETNRCRTVAAPNEAAVAGVRDVETIRQNPAGWWLAGAALLLGALYGIWEWRYDLAEFLARWRK